MGMGPGPAGLAGGAGRHQDVLSVAQKIPSEAPGSLGADGEMLMWHGAGWRARRSQAYGRGRSRAHRGDAPCVLGASKNFLPSELSWPLGIFSVCQQQRVQSLLEEAALLPWDFSCAGAAGAM